MDYNVFAVTDSLFGARGDGVADDTDAIQAALNAAARYGGVVWLTPTEGYYRCEGPLTIPRHVTLKGGYGGMRSGLKLWNDTPRGSLLYVVTRDDFITMSTNSIIDGIELFYPEQRLQGTPITYGWTINVPAHQHNVTIRNIACPNPYKFIYVNANGILIDGVQGFPLAKGIVLDRVADVARINNIHFNPGAWFSADASIRDWTLKNASCLDIGFAEEFMIHNFFGYGYLRGFWFTGYPEDPKSIGSYGSINNFGFDKVQEGILIQTNGISGRQGVSLNNGRIIPFGGPVGSRAGIKFSDSLDEPLENPNSCPSVSMSNVSFFSAHERSIWIEPNSAARITILGGQSTEFINEMVLCQSTNAVVRLFGMRSFNASGPRINNPGGSDVKDLEPILS